MSIKNSELNYTPARWCCPGGQGDDNFYANSIRPN